MQEDICWICGSQMLNTSVIRADRGGWVIIKCKSCLTDLIVTPIGDVKKGLQKLPERDGIGI